MSLIKQNVNMHNKFDIHIDNIETGEHREVEAYNIVLNSLYSRLIQGQTYFTNIHFGTGDGTPEPTRTSLFRHLGTKTVEAVDLSYGFPLTILKQKIVLNPEEYVGQVISEVGIAYGLTASYLTTHALLKDAEGNTITITKSATDVLTIYATVYITIDTSNESIHYLRWIDEKNNALLNFLTSTSGTPWNNMSNLKVHLSRCLNEDNSLGASSGLLIWRADVAGRRRYTDNLRFDINTANGDAQVVSIPYLLDMEIPSPGVYDGTKYTGVAVGVGDGVTKTFKLPSLNVRDSSIKMKVNGEVINDFTIKKQNTVFVKSKNHPISIPTYANSSFLTDDKEYAITTTSNANYAGKKMFLYRKVDIFYQFEGIEQLPAEMFERLSNAFYDGMGDLIIVATHNVSPFWRALYIDRDNDKLVEIIDIENRKEKIVRRASITRDGQYAIILYETSPYIQYYRNDNHKLVELPPIPLTLTSGYAYNIYLSDNGKTASITLSASPWLRVFDFDGSTWTERPPCTTSQAIGYTSVLTSDGKRIIYYENVTDKCFVSVDWDGSAWVNKLLLPANATSSNSMFFINDKTLFAMGSSNPYLVVYDYDKDNNIWIDRNVTAVPSQLLSSNWVTNDEWISHVRDSTFNQVYPTTAYYVTFNVPPEENTAITAEYIVNGIHKTDQYVVDFSMSITFGEG